MPLNILVPNSPAHLPRPASVRTRAAIVAIAVIAGLACAAHAQTAQFFPLSDRLQDPRIQGSWAYGLNSDGTIIVGAAYVRSPQSPFEHRAAVWRFPAGGEPSLPESLQGDDNFATAAVAVSDDGDKVVGSAGLFLEYFDGRHYDPRNAFYWWGLNSGSPEVAIVNNVLEFHDIAADGSVAVGQLRLTDWPEPLPTFAFEWRGPGTPFLQLPTPGWASGAYSLTSDGRASVGYFGNPDAGAINGAIWTRAGIAPIPGFPPSRWHEAHAISGNGRWITGPTDPDGFLWGESADITVVAQLPGSGWLRPSAVANDGRTIIGECVTDTGEAWIHDAIIWHPTDAAGSRRLSDELTERGVDLTGWTLLNATAMSDDGSVIVGYAINPTQGRQAFAVRLCRADFDRNGQADFFDYLDFVSAFASEDPAADFDGNGQVDFFDYLDFAATFGAGC
jgi:uncharacterized membrane protein